MANVGKNIVGAGEFVGKNYKPLLYLALAAVAGFILYRVVKKVTTGQSLGPDKKKLDEKQCEVCICWTRISSLIECTGQCWMKIENVKYTELISVSSRYWYQNTRFWLAGI